MLWWQIAFYYSVGKGLTYCRRIMSLEVSTGFLLSHESIVERWTWESNCKGMAGFPLKVTHKLGHIEMWVMQTCGLSGDNCDRSVSLQRNRVEGRAAGCCGPCPCPLLASESLLVSPCAFSWECVVRKRRGWDLTSKLRQSFLFAMAMYSWCIFVSE